MRVISGEARGRKLKAPRSQGVTRPMADKIKEALFSVLASLGVEYDRVLDLYAGSGSVGIEALSRGASWCDFVDRDQHAVRAIRDNLAHVGFADRGKIHPVAVLTAIRAVRGPYDVVFFDPPYADPEIHATLVTLSESAAVRDGTIVAIGHSPRVEMPERLGRLALLRERRHGDSCFAVYDVVLEADGGEMKTVTGESPAEG
ncbi:MAG TPA: 16S rRNA (guanine(966)-N(2))-methyltransferase RsmD [Thermomicrobiales bacterium]|nr:16S rRNA (guanine(966)-N(2))-methyltransferase RsmD [Thermomicrobiales bacterium]